MVQSQPKLLTNTWLTATWEEFLQVTDNSTYTKAKGYYYGGQMRVEMGVGPDHASNNGIIHVIITLYCALKGIPLRGLVNCSYRKPGVREAQPDVSYYLGERASLAPQGSSVVNLDQVPPPDLAIEIADTSLNDDLGKKRLLYEELGVSEYWVVDVEKAEIIAFQMINCGSKRIQQSQVLPNLEIAVIREAIEQRQQMDDGQLVAWLMAKFQAT
ncbi:Uma2 family endonuclease [Leptolyngbya sp. 7M]|uniref:Uma2 family endonuclease n=1 Tax=Leptolyngbya sp. 7M TaxID=2812896 RepID=UPI001B8AB9CC|nr:Uma2 family endonuclease [Leptolyngbya sp. 7M]QYO62988.1 Uma2 family endonuclease [Leptolyngbya sp. 7M]